MYTGSTVIRPFGVTGSARMRTFVTSFIIAIISEFVSTSAIGGSMSSYGVESTGVTVSGGTTGYTGVFTSFTGLSRIRVGVEFISTFISFVKGTIGFIGSGTVIT